MKQRDTDSDTFLKRVNGEITTREYLKSLDERVTERRKSDARDAERPKKKSE